MEAEKQHQRLGKDAEGIAAIDQKLKEMLDNRLITQARYEATSTSPDLKTKKRFLNSFGTADELLSVLSQIKDKGELASTFEGVVQLFNSKVTGEPTPNPENTYSDKSKQAVGVLNTKSLTSANLSAHALTLAGVEVLKECKPEYPNLVFAIRYKESVRIWVTATITLGNGPPPPPPKEVQRDSGKSMGATYM